MSNVSPHVERFKKFDGALRGFRDVELLFACKLVCRLISMRVQGVDYLKNEELTYFGFDSIGPPEKS